MIYKHLRHASEGAGKKCQDSVLSSTAAGYADRRCVAASDKEKSPDTFFACGNNRNTSSPVRP